MILNYFKYVILKVRFPFLQPFMLCFSTVILPFFRLLKVFPSVSVCSTFKGSSVMTVILIYKNIETKSAFKNTHSGFFHEGDTGDLLPFLTAASLENFLLDQITCNNLLLLCIMSHQFCFCGTEMCSKPGNKKSA